MTNYLNWVDIGTMYDLLGLSKNENIAECRCVALDENMDLTKVISREFFTNPIKLIEWARDFNGKGNCFIGRNPRKEIGGKEIKHISCITLDLDPIRPKGQIVTQEQTRECIYAGQSILDRFQGGTLCATGNGALLVWTTSVPIVEDFKSFEDKIKQFQNECSEIIKEFKGVKIDSTQDSARLVKLIGTVSVKGGTKITRFIHISSCAGDGDELFRHVREFRTVNPISKETLLAKSVSDDRSRNDFALALHYKQKGLNASDTLEALAHHALGRPDRLDDHRRIIEKVFNKVQFTDSNNDPILHSPQSSLEDYIKGLDKRMLNDKPDLPTGFSEFDKATHGLRRGEIYTIAARPAVGKSSYLLNVANVLCSRGKRVLLLSTEMAFYAIWDRFFSIGAEIDGTKFNKGGFTAEENKRKDEFYTRFKDFDFHVCDAFVPNIEAVEKFVKDICPDVLMFDHIQHIEGGEDYKSLSLFTQQLKRLARTYDCAVLIASQLRRPLQFTNYKTGDVTHSKPTINDLKGCGKIEEESAFVILLYPSGTVYDENMPIIRAELAKNRYGPNILSDLVFNQPLTKFKQMEEQQNATNCIA